MLDGESHVTKIDRVFTLDAYVHFALTGEFVTGVGDASGMFPQKFGDYDQEMVDKFDALAGKKYKGFSLRKVFPKVLLAGQDAGSLTKEGALLLDPSGDLEAGIPFAPPEGDAGTGMVATNAIRKYTGNTSAGTSTFAMLVLDKPLSKPYRELDMVTTPTGYPVAMAHANNGTTDINKWMDLFAGIITLYNGAPAAEASEKRGKPAPVEAIDMGRLFTSLFKASTYGKADCDGLVTYGYYSGEGITGLNEGRPLMVKSPETDMDAANRQDRHGHSLKGRRRPLRRHDRPRRIVQDPGRGPAVLSRRSGRPRESNGNRLGRRPLGDGSACRISAGLRRKVARGLAGRHFQKYEFHSLPAHKRGRSGLRVLY